MKRYFDLNSKTDNNFCDVIDPSYMVEIPNDGKPYGEVNGTIQDISQTPEYIAEQERLEQEAKNKEIYKQLEELDLKSIRALRSNDESRLELLETQATELRKQLQ